MPFSDPILAGEELIREAIRSPDYVAGAAGWRIAADGSAEFNDTTVRGELLANGSTGSSIRVLADASSQQARIEITPPDVAGHPLDNPASVNSSSNANGFVSVSLTSPQVADHTDRAFMWLAAQPADPRTSARLAAADVTISTADRTTLEFAAPDGWTRYEFTHDALRVTNDGVTTWAELDQGRLRLPGTGDVSLTSTGHVLQTGPDTGANIAYDGNEIQARNNGAAGTLMLNGSGGSVTVGNVPVLRGDTGEVLMSFSNQPSATVAVSFGRTYPSAPVVIGNIDTAAGAAARWLARPINVTTTGFTMFVFSADTSVSTWSNVRVNWVALLEA